MTTQRELASEAARLAAVLKQRGLKIVLAESCTGGLVSAALAGIPGISAHLCGSAVVYRAATKAAWLDIPEAMLTRPGPVSRPVAAEMAASILRHTPEADLAVSITGHLGPDAPPRQLGLVYVAIARREGAEIRTSVARHRLSERPIPTRSLALLEFRRRRQREAARLVLVDLRIALGSSNRPDE